MSQKNIGVNGFKFSFKIQEGSAVCTPKFTSIQLDSDGFSKARNKQSTQKLTIRSKNQQKIFPLDSMFKKRQKKIDLSFNHRNLTIKTEHKDYQNYESERNEQIKNITLSIDNKKVVLTNRQKHKTFVKNESQKLLKISKINQDNQLSHFNDKEAVSSYLQIYKREKKQRKLNQNRNTLKSLSLTKKFLNPFQKIDQSPKSVSSFRKAPKIFNKFFQKNNNELEVDTQIFPQTQKNKRFMETQQNIGGVLRKNDNYNRLSKALFKGQKTNVNVRLNNIGGNINKLNIQID